MHYQIFIASAVYIKLIQCMSKQFSRNDEHRGLFPSARRKHVPEHNCQGRRSCTRKNALAHGRIGGEHEDFIFKIMGQKFNSMIMPTDHMFRPLENLMIEESVG